AVDAMRVLRPDKARCPAASLQCAEADAGSRPFDNLVLHDTSPTMGDAVPTPCGARRQVRIVAYAASSEATPSPPRTTHRAAGSSRAPSGGREAQDLVASARPPPTPEARILGTRN